MTDAGGEPVAEAGMLIRRPVAEVFEAFVDPAVTTRFWFTRSSGRLEPGARVRWDWEVYGVGTQVEVQAVEPCRRIRIVWDAPDDPTTVEWTFDERGPNWTLVSVVQSGFDPAAEDVVAKVADSSGGFALVLAGAKAWLEHGLALNLVADRHPDALVEGWGDRR